MGALLEVLFSFIASVLSRVFTFEVAKFLAYKVLLKIVLFTALFVVMRLAIIELLDYTFDVVSSNVSDSVVLQVTGLGAWILQQLRFQDWFSAILSALSVRLVLRMLPLSPAK